MDPATNINWNGFVKLRNDESNIIEAAKCKTCATIIQDVSLQRLDIHRILCQKKNETKRGFNCDNYLDEMDVDSGGLPDNADISKMMDILNRDLGKFFFSASIPFAQVENKYLSTFIKHLCQFKISYKPPSRITLGTTILKNVNEEIFEKKKKLLRNTDSILLTDGWRNKTANKKYLVFSIRNINTPQTYLSFQDISTEQENGENISNFINKAIKFAKDVYDTNIYAIVTDNDNKIVRAGRLSVTVDNKPLIQSTCASHSGNLLLKSFVDEQLMEKIREIVNVFRDPKAESLLIQKNGTKLQNYPVTRFCFFRDSCQSILKNIAKLKELCVEGELTICESVINSIMDPEFQCKLKEVIKNLEPVCQLINKCQDSKSNIADAVELWLALNDSNIYNPDIVSSRIDKCIWPVAYAANLMHHKYNGLRLSACQRLVAEEFLHDNLNDDAKKELQDYFEHRENYNTYACCEDPIAYWTLIKWALPNLSLFIIKIMLIPASTAAIEGLFSNWTFVHNTYRNRLKDNKSAMLLDVYYSLKFQHFSDNEHS